MIRNHLRHIRRGVDGRLVPVRIGIPLAALFSLPVFGTGVRDVGRVLDPGQLVLPLLVLAYVPAVVALVTVWSIECDVCRGTGPT